MRLTVALKLLPRPEQASLLETTLARANDAANLLSAIAWEQQTFGQFALHRLAYARVRAESGLTAQADYLGVLLFEMQASGFSRGLLIHGSQLSIGAGTPIAVGYLLMAAITGYLWLRAEAPAPAATEPGAEPALADG